MKKVHLLITPASNPACLDILCSDFSAIEWLPGVMKEKYPASILSLVKRTAVGDPYYCQILLNAHDEDIANVLTWLCQIMIDKGGKKISDQAAEFVFEIN